MVFTCGKSKEPEKKKSEDIDKQIKTWMKSYDKIIKLLLLGAGESGKTTIIKQMKILHISGFDTSERQEKCLDIRRNIVESICTLIRQMPVLDPPIEIHNENKESLEYITNLEIFSDLSLHKSENTDLFGNNSWFSQLVPHVSKLWNDSGVQECYRRRNEFQLIDCCKFFLDRLDDIGKPDYTPSDQDILHSRRMTTDIQKVEFKVKVPQKYGGGSLDFWMFDVGGQRGERRKWIQVFEGIHAILFLVACSSFDQTIREDNKTNRLKESLSLFQDVWQSRFLQNSGFILFLNKQDVLKEKVMSGTSIGKYFPDYEDYKSKLKDPNGGDEYIKTRSFIQDKFINASSAPSRGTEMRKYSVGPGFGGSLTPQTNRQLYYHFTTATDTRNIKTVFDDVHSMVIRWNMEKVGIL